MKIKLLTLACALMVTLAGNGTSMASDDKGAVMVVDVVVVRPVCLAATVLGAAVFVVILPFQAIFQRKGINNTAAALVTTPAKATFTRPIGDMDTIGD